MGKKTDREDYPSIDMQQFGRKLRSACEEKNVKACDLQSFLGLGSVQAVYMWFEGKRMPSLDNLYALSKYLGVKMEELIDESMDSREVLQKWSRPSDEKRRLMFYWTHLQEEKKG